MNKSKRVDKNLTYLQELEELEESAMGGFSVASNYFDLEKEKQREQVLKQITDELFNQQP